MDRVIVRSQETPLGAEDIVGLRSIADAGGLIVYPTRNLYGLGVSIFSKEGIERVNALKQRPGEMSLSIMAMDRDIRELCRMTEPAKAFIESGDIAITAVLPSSSTAPGTVVSEATVAVRLPPSELCVSLVNGLGPITATSANVHGREPPSTISQAMEQLGDDVTIYIDGGELGGEPTTLVDLTGEQPKVLREGLASLEDVVRRYGR